MDFRPTPQVEELRERIRGFMADHVYPVEAEVMRALDEEVKPGVPYPEILVGIRERAKAEGLWNLFLPDEQYGPGLTNWEYGMLCEEMGRSPVAAPMAFNCAAPDTGNTEILVDHGTEEQKERFLAPLLEGQIRSCFSMTEPEVPGSDPTTLQASAELDGDEWVINGHKWFTSGAVGAEFAIAMVVTEPDAHPYARASMIIVPVDNPGFELVRPVPVMGHDKGPGHCEVRYTDCRVSKGNLLGDRGAGFVIAQDRLGPGRIHHCMRAIGTAERAIEMMCDRANSRETFGEKLAENVVMDVLDRAIQVHGALGMSDDTPLAGMWRFSRMLKVADGPDEVHKMVIARRELNRWNKEAETVADASLKPEPAPVGAESAAT